MSNEITTIAELLCERKVQDLEKAMMGVEQVSCPVIHRFGPGIYIREVKIPAGTLAVGHHQNFEQLNIFLKGKVTVYADDGTTKCLTAPMMFVGPPGRKVGMAHEDVVWLNVYSTNETDVEKLELHFLTKSDGWLEAKNKFLIADQTEQRKDFLRALCELGVSEDLCRAQSEATDDRVELPYGGYKVKVAPSPIEGQGLFATAEINEGDLIAPARIDGKRTIAGRFTNHSGSPNAKMVGWSGGDIVLMATRKISGCRGGLDGEEITVDYRQAFSLTKKLGLLCLE